MIIDRQAVLNLRTTRLIASGIHIIVACFQLAYIYTPLHDVPHMLTVVQWISTPTLLLTGFWLSMGKRFYK